MKDRDIQDTIEMFAARGRTIDDYDARVYFAATENLGREPDNAVAKETVAQFRAFMLTGVRSRSFVPFLIPESLLESDEDRAKRAAWVAAHPEGTS
jgi:hypothetical protein